MGIFKKTLFVLSFAVLAIITTIVFHEFNQAGIEYSKGHRFFKYRFHEQAIPYFEKAVQIRKNYKSAMEELALSALWTGKLELAKQNFEKLLKIDSKSRVARRGLADIVAWQGNPKNAIIIYDQMLKENSRDMKTIFSLANAQYDLGDYQNASENYKKFLKWEPTHQEALLRLADCLIKLNKNNEAEDIFKTLETRFSNFPNALKAIGSYQMSLKNYDLAEKYFSRALFINKKDIEALSKLAECKAEMDSLANAIKMLDESSNEYPDDSAIKVTGINFLIKYKEYDLASAELSEFAAKWPDDPAVLDLRKQLSDIYIDQKKYPNAELNLRKMIEKDSKNKALLEKLGDMLYYQGKFKEAEVYYKRAEGLK